jgi:hypothetical protein
MRHQNVAVEKDGKTFHLTVKDMSKVIGKTVKAKRPIIAQMSKKRMFVNLGPMGGKRDVIVGFMMYLGDPVKRRKTTKKGVR